MIRESISPKALAKEYGLESRQLANWKRAYLQKLKTATKGSAPKGSAGKKGVSKRSEQPLVLEDISRQRVRAEDAKRPDPLLPFPTQAPSELESPAGDVEADTMPASTQASGGLPERRAAGVPPRGLNESAEVMSQVDGHLPPGQGTEISGEAQDRFSKNWEKMGANAPPLMQAPQPVRLNRHERFVTRFQNLPGVAWFLHGGRLDVSPWLILLAALGVVGVAVFLMKDAAEHASPEFQVIPGETPHYLAPMNRDEVHVAEGLLAKFFANRSVAGFEPLVRSPQTIMPLITHYYTSRSVRPVEVVGFDYHRRADLPGMDITLHGVKLGPLAKVHEVAIEHTPDGARVDWETAIGYQSMGWRELRTAHPVETTYFRLSLQPSRYYGKPFTEGIFRSFRLTYPGELRVINGYAMVDTDVEMRLRELLPDDESVSQLVVGLQFPHGDHREDLVEITEIWSESWVVAYEPGERHFDLATPAAALPVPNSLPDSAPVPVPAPAPEATEEVEEDTEKPVEPSDGENE